MKLLLLDWEPLKVRDGVGFSTPHPWSCPVQDGLRPCAGGNPALREGREREAVPCGPEVQGTVDENVNEGSWGPASLATEGNL